LAVCLSDMGGSSLRYAGKAGPLRFLGATKRPSGEAFPAPTTPLPWDEGPEQVDDEVEDEDYADDEEDSTEYAGGRF
jgi:hypothetical protein